MCNTFLTLLQNSLWWYVSVCVKEVRWIWCSIARWAKWQQCANNGRQAVWTNEADKRIFFDPLKEILCADSAHARFAPFSVTAWSPFIPKQHNNEVLLGFKDAPEKKYLSKCDKTGLEQARRNGTSYFEYSWIILNLLHHEAVLLKTWN